MSAHSRSTRYRLITFDAYTGLSDQCSSLRPVIEGVLGLPPERATAFLAEWRAGQLGAAALSNGVHHPAGRPRVSFRECTALALDHAARVYGFELGTEDRAALLAAWYPMTPWPEAPDVLATLCRRGYALAILSNGDRDMLEAITGQYATPFDYILSSEDAGVYKPHPTIYELPLQVAGVARDDCLHVAGSGNDVVGAKAAGIACYWSNRRNASVLLPAYCPDFEGRDLTGLLDILP